MEKFSCRQCDFKTRSDVALKRHIRVCTSKEKKDVYKSDESDPITAAVASDELSLHFNTDGDKLMTASFDNTAKIWDVCTGNCLFTLNGHSAELSCG